jgi:peptidoglycan pentaglycine glycine transferase (the first glycine)
MADWTASEWNPIIANLPGAHLLQTWEWAEVKSLTGWKPLPQVWKDSSGKVVAAAMVLQKPISMGGFSTKTCILYIPRGPVMDWADSTLRHRVLDDLQAFAIRKGAIFLKLDAELLLGKGEPGTERASENPTGIETQHDLD